MVNDAPDTALFGGSFDPPHMGHLEIVRKLLEHPAIQRVVVVPSWLNPFKERSHAPAQKRLEWCRRLFDLPGVVVSDYEIRQGRPVYTVETLRELRKSFPIGWIVVGADNLADLPRWKEFDELDRTLEWIVATREGHEADRSRLRRSELLRVSVPVSSTQIRQGGGREYLDSTIAEEVERLYPAHDRKEDH